MTFTFVYENKSKSVLLYVFQIIYKKETVIYANYLTDLITEQPTEVIYWVAALLNT